MTVAPWHERLAVNQTEASQLLGITTQTLISMRRQGRIHAIVIGDGGKVLYPVSEIRRFLGMTGEANAHETGDAPSFAELSAENERLRKELAAMKDRMATAAKAFGALS